MTSPLRVNPDSLRAAATTEAAVGESVAGMGVGQSMTSAGAAVSGLLSAGACQYAGSAVDAALGTVQQDLATHSTNLSTAAERYATMDAELGQLLRKFVS